MSVNIPYPYFEIRVDASGKLEDQKQIDALMTGLDSHHVTDLFVASHGWNNDAVAANELYSELFTNVKAQEANVSSNGRKFAVAGIIWPSKKFDAADDAPNAASFGDNSSRIEKQIDTLKALLADEEGGSTAQSTLDEAKALIPKLEGSASARKKFSEIVLSHLPGSVSEEHDRVLSNEVAANMIADDKLLSQLGTPPRKTASGASGGAATMGFAHPAASSNFEGAAGIGDFFKGVKAGAANLLNYVTYYKMKDRAGTVGRGAVNALLGKLREEKPQVRLHVVGHSFGCRVVTAAVTGKASEPKNFVDSMSLLQGAFSHFSFSSRFDDSGKTGFYRNLIDEHRVRGPVIITHTRADKAVGMAYAIASRAAGQIASAVGDRDDPFGGLGSNGAQKTSEVREGSLPKAGKPFNPALAAGSVTNMRADGLISDHGDVRNPNVAYAVLSAACT